jgi:hypothetical protein
MTGRSARRWECPLAMLAAAVLACEGGAGQPASDAGVVGGDASGDTASDGELPAEMFAGVWAGLTSQNLPVSLVVAEDGTITDLHVRLLLEYPEGGWCSAAFLASRLPRLTQGKAEVRVTSTATSTQIPVTLSFASPGMATGSYGGLSGAYRVTCGTETARTGTGTLLAAGSFSLRRERAVAAPPAEDTRMLAPAGSPLPGGMATAGCSQQVGSSRVFCAVTRAGPLGDTELWVVEPDRLRAAGKPCDVSDEAAGCLQLHPRLRRATTTGTLPVQRFVGDTLLFEPDEAPVGVVSQVGRTSIHAWRPGWPQARRLFDNAYRCEADAASDAIACLTDYTSTPMGPIHADLWAGRLGDGQQPLQKIERLVLFTAADRTIMGATLVYQLGFSPGGAHLVWSVRPADAPTARETVYTIALADSAGAPPAARRELVNDASYWRWSQDGKRLYWLRGYDRVGRAGALEVADFAAPSTPRSLLPATGPSYFPVAGPGAGTEGVIALQASGALVRIADASVSPVVAEMVDQGVTAIRTLATDSRRVAYSKTRHPTDTAWGDLYLAELGSPLRKCYVSAEVEWSAPVFSSSGRLLVAGRTLFDEVNDVSAHLIDASSCQRLQMVGDANYWQRLPGDRFLIGGATRWLRKFGLVDLTLLEPGAKNTPLSPPVEAVSARWGLHLRSEAAQDTATIIYSVNAGWRTDGLYQRRLTLSH